MRSNGDPRLGRPVHSDFWVDRAAGVGAAIFTQLLPFVDPRMVETLVGFEMAVYARNAELVAG